MTPQHAALFPRSEIALGCRVQVTLATGIPREVCDEIALGYRDPATIRLEDFANREDEGVLLVPKAGEMLYHLRERPAWAREM